MTSTSNMVYFDSASHTYRLGDKTFKRSVTQVVNEYVPPFPAEMIAGKIAKKEGVETQDILDKWELNKNIACAYGDAVDLAVRYYVSYGEMPKQEHLQAIVERFKADYTGDLVANITAYSEEHSVVGTTDIIEKLGDKKVKIIDVKSNADFYKKGNGKLLAPFNDLENNNLNKYRLQLSIYRDLFAFRGIQVEGLEVWHSQLGVINIEPLNTTEIWNKIQTNQT